MIITNFILLNFDKLNYFIKIFKYQNKLPKHNILLNKFKLLRTIINYYNFVIIFFQLNNNKDH